MLAVLRGIVQKVRGHEIVRSHERFPIWETRFSHIWINDVFKAEPINLSYGGAKLKLTSPEEQLFSELPDHMRLKVHILDQDLEVDAIKTHADGQEGGIRFLRDPSRVLELLDMVVDGMRIGASLWGASIRSLGEGATELHLEGIDRTRVRLTLGPDLQDVPSFRLTYFKSGWEYALTIKDSKMFTATAARPELRVVDDKAVSGPLIEAQVVRQSFFIMMGVVDPAIRVQLARPIQLCLEALGQPLS